MINLKKSSKYLVILLLGIMLALEISSILQESQTVDEGTHLAGGYSYLKTGDFRLNAEHPPLIKMMSASFLLPLNPDLPLSHPGWSESNQWWFANRFLYHNRIPADLMLFLGRLPMILLSLLLGFSIYKFTLEVFGPKASILALILYVFDPNIIAHSRYITTDLGLALFFLLSIYCLRKYFQQPTLKNLIIGGLILALAIVTKFSGLILIPIFIILYLIKWWQEKEILKGNYSFKKLILSILLISLIIFSVIFIIYGFELKKPVEDPGVQKLYHDQEEIIKADLQEQQMGLVKFLIKITDTSKASGQFIRKVAENFSVPAYSYFKGLTILFTHNYWGHLSYLLGNYSNQGWWYYFPIAFLVKTPLATLILIVILMYILIRKFILGINFYYNQRLFQKTNFFINTLKHISFDYYILIIPPLVYFLWSLTSHINLGLRHILLIYPFLFILLGNLVNIKIWKFQKAWRGILIFLMAFYLISSLSIYPHYLAYFNEAVGGPEKGPQYLVDSNIDWGQDLKKLKKYLDQNQISTVYLSYFGTAEVGYYKINFQRLPTTSEINPQIPFRGVAAISVSSLFSKEREFSWLLEYEPEAKIGYSIFVYDLR